MNIIALLLIPVLVLTSGAFPLPVSPRSATSSEQTDEARHAAKFKAQVQKRNVGEQSRVRVRMLDGTEVNGYISKVEENSFEVTNTKSGKIIAISYTDVDKVTGPGLSKGAGIVIGVGILVGVVAAILWALYPKT